MWRKRFKTIFLGVLYGLGKKSLAERLNATEEEAEDIIQGLYKSFPKLREYVASQQQYPLNNNGYINTMLGDKLQVQEWKYYQAATSQREKKNQEARIQRLGVNLPINNLWPYRVTYKRKDREPRKLGCAMEIVLTGKAEMPIPC